MPEPMDDLFSFLDDDALTIPHPIKSTKHPEGKVYSIPYPDAETGLRLTALAEIGRKVEQRRRGDRNVKISAAEAGRLVMDDKDEREFAMQVLGETYQELIDDGVRWPIIQRLVQYAYVYFAMGANAAENAARDGLFTGGKAFVPANRSERRAAASGKTGTRQTQKRG